VYCYRLGDLGWSFEQTWPVRIRNVGGSLGGSTPGLFFESDVGIVGSVAPGFEEENVAVAQEDISGNQLLFADGVEESAQGGGGVRAVQSVAHGNEARAVLAISVGVVSLRVHDATVDLVTDKYEVECIGFAFETKRMDRIRKCRM